VSVEKLLRLSQAAAMLGVTERTLIYWDTVGTVKIVRTPGNQRRISESEAARILSNGIEPQNKAGLIYFDKVAQVIGFTLKTMTLEIFAMRTISALIRVNRVVGGCVLIETDSRGEEVYELDLFGELLGFTKETIMREMAGVKFYLEGQSSTL
jgi:hypothetical protein